MGAGQHAKASGVVKGQGATGRSLGQFGRGRSSAGGGICPWMQGKQSAEDQPTNRQWGPRGNLDPSSTGPGTWQGHAKGMAFPGECGAGGGCWGGHKACRTKGKAAGREGRTTRSPERNQRGWGEDVRRDSVHQGNWDENARDPGKEL